MDLKTILLIQLLACVAMASAESFEDPEHFIDFDEYEKSEDENDIVIPKLAPSDCQYQIIKKCNHVFKSLFHGKKRLTGVLSDREVYCKGIQSFIQCLEGSNCRGVFIDNYGYVILQHGMMDKKLNVCPMHSFGVLKKKLKAITLKHLFIDDIGNDKAASCSYAVHKKCVNLFTASMKQNSNMCQDVQSFLDCYKKEAPNCPSKITQHFAHLCNQLGEHMLKANEKHIGMMC